MPDLWFASVLIASKAMSSAAHACLGRKRGAAIARTKVAAAIVHMSSLVTLALIAFGCLLSNTLGAPLACVLSASLVAKAASSAHRYLPLHAVVQAYEGEVVDNSGVADKIPS